MRGGCCLANENVTLCVNCERTIMDIELVLLISVGSLAAAWVLLAMFTIYVWSQNRRLRMQLDQMGVGKFRVQKLKMAKADSNYAYQNKSITPDEELARRGYSMYSGEPDLEAGHSQNSTVFVEDIAPQQSRQPATNAPPFLLNSIEDNKRKSLSNPVAKNNRHLGRNSSSNPNFIY